MSSHMAGAVLPSSTSTKEVRTVVADEVDPLVSGSESSGVTGMSPEVGSPASVPRPALESSVNHRHNLSKFTFPVSSSSNLIAQAQLRAQCQAHCDDIAPNSAVRDEKKVSSSLTSPPRTSDSIISGIDPAPNSTHLGTSSGGVTITASHVVASASACETSTFSFPPSSSGRNSHDLQHAQQASFDIASTPSELASSTVAPSPALTIQRRRASSSAAHVAITTPLSPGVSTVTYAPGNSTSDFDFRQEGLQTVVPRSSSTAGNSPTTSSTVAGGDSHEVPELFVETPSTCHSSVDLLRLNDSGATRIERETARTAPVAPEADDFSVASSIATPYTAASVLTAQGAHEGSSSMRTPTPRLSFSLAPALDSRLCDEARKAITQLDDIKTDVFTKRLNIAKQEPTIEDVLEEMVHNDAVSLDSRLAEIADFARQLLHISSTLAQFASSALEQQQQQLVRPSRQLPQCPSSFDLVGNTNSRTVHAAPQYAPMDPMQLAFQQQLPTANQFVNSVAGSVMSSTAPSSQHLFQENFFQEFCSPEDEGLSIYAQTSGHAPFAPPTQMRFGVTPLLPFRRQSLGQSLMPQGTHTSTAKPALLHAVVSPAGGRTPVARSPAFGSVTSTKSLRNGAAENAGSFGGSQLANGNGDFPFASDAVEPPHMELLSFIHPVSVPSFHRSHRAQFREDGGFEMINDYIIMDELGRGATGTVFLAIHQHTEKAYAIKSINTARARAPRVMQARASVLSLNHEPAASNKGLVDTFATEHSQRVAPLPGTASVTSPSLMSSRRLSSPPSGAIQPSRGSDAQPPHTNPIEREIAILCRLKHKNLVTLHEVIDDEEEDQIHLVMDYCSNGPLITVKAVAAARAASGAYVSPRAAKNRCSKGFETSVIRPLAKLGNYALQITSALKYLHSLDIIHRDIKPDNILISDQDEVKITDFGESAIVAKLDGLDESIQNKSMSTRLAGTPMFFAPEMCQRFQPSETPTPSTPCDGKPADIWAFGVTLFASVTGRFPFHGSNFQTLTRSIMDDDIYFPTYHELVENEHVDEVEYMLWVDVINRMLNKSCAQRISLRELKLHPCFVTPIETRNQRDVLDICNRVRDMFATQRSHAHEDDDNVDKAQSLFRNTSGEISGPSSVTAPSVALRRERQASIVDITQPAAAVIVHKRQSITLGNYELVVDAPSPSHVQSKKSNTPHSILHTDGDVVDHTEPDDQQPHDPWTAPDDEVLVPSPPKSDRTTTQQPRLQKILADGGDTTVRHSSVPDTPNIPPPRRFTQHFTDDAPSSHGVNGNTDASNPKQAQAAAGDVAPLVECFGIARSTSDGSIEEDETSLELLRAEIYGNPGSTSKFSAGGVSPVVPGISSPPVSSRNASRIVFMSQQKCRSIWQQAQQLGIPSCQSGANAMGNSLHSMTSHTTVTVKPLGSTSLRRNIGGVVLHEQPDDELALFL